MKANRKFVAIISLATVVILSVAMAKPETKETPQYQNLKVLPKNISSKDLNGIMVDDFQDALGVGCDFCHAASKDGHGLDFVSDVKPEKNISRAMMRMTIGLNKKYFMAKHPLIGSNALVVTCNTCHKGQAFPDGAEPK